jgi:hemoglobin/transferrin/lactoferrin receptor protein
MSSRLTRQSSSPSRVLSLLTAAMLMAGAAPLMAATPAEQPTRNMGDYTFTIAPQSLVSALNAFTAVTGWQVGLPAELAEGVASPGVRGSLPPEKALDRLLVGTNLSYRKLGNNNIVLEPPQQRQRAQSATNDHQRHPSGAIGRQRAQHRHRPHPRRTGP